MIVIGLSCFEKVLSENRFLWRLHLRLGIPFHLVGQKKKQHLFWCTETIFFQIAAVVLVFQSFNYWNKI